MLVTEDEAKTKRCQESFGDGYVADGMTAMVSGSARAVVASPLHCLGSACMAWRWREAAAEERWDKIVPHPDEVRQRMLEGYEVDPNHRGGLRKKIAEGRPWRGYCGKGGNIYRFD